MMVRQNTRGRFAVALAALLATGLILTTARTSLSAARLNSSGLDAPQGASDHALILLSPSAASPGQAVSVEGVGFPPRHLFDLTAVYSNGMVLPLGQLETDDGGWLGGVAVEIPASLLSGSFSVVAQSTTGPQQVSASGYVTARIPTVSLSNGVGKAGDTVVFSANGFAPGEQVAAHLKGLTGSPFAIFSTDEWGNIVEAPAIMPFGPTGENTVILIGEQSKAVTSASFIVIGFFPTVTLSNYAPKGDEAVGFTGSGFGPNEQVRIYVNGVATPPVKTVRVDNSGVFEEPYGFDVPFGAIGKQTFIFVGESSGTVTAADFEVVPYAPSVEPSTWSGRPGTSVTFYGSGFARSELVRVRRAATRLQPAEEASCFRTDENGRVGGLGSYMIQPTDEVGQLNLELITEKSQVTVPLTIQILPAIGDVPPGAVRPNRGCDQVGG